MAGYTIDADDVDQVLALIRGVEGIRSVDLEAAKVNAPGVWLNVLGYRLDRLAAGAYTLDTQLVLIVPDQEPARARKALLELLNLVLTVVKPSGRVEHRTVVVPDTPAPLPGLAFPFVVNCVPTIP